MSILINIGHNIVQYIGRDKSVIIRVNIAHNIALHYGNSHLSASYPGNIDGY